VERFVKMVADAPSIVRAHEASLPTADIVSARSA
jgi:hypothetical protein